MPFKRNPIHAENMDSLARFVAALPAVAWNNAAHCLLERTLDDSANRRLILPEAFLATDELLIRAIRIVEGLRVRQTAIARNLRQYGVFAASERLLMEAVKAGGDRQRLHEVLREHSIAAWEAIEAGQPNPLKELLCHEPDFLGLLPVERIEGLLDAGDYVGIAPRRAKEVSQCIRQMLILPQSESGDRRNP